MAKKTDYSEIIRANRLPAEVPKGFLFRRGSEYSSRSDFKILEETEDISSIIDRLLRITTKVTESYASDIVYDIRALEKARRDKESYCKLLVFHAHGVNTYNAGFDAKNVPFVYLPKGSQAEIYGLGGIQHWLLAYAPASDRCMPCGKTLLMRYDFSGTYYKDVQPAIAPTKFFHVTRKSDVGSIIKNGLIPQIGERAKKFGENAPRIYLFGSRKDAENALCNWLGEEFNDGEELVILQIKLPQEFPVLKDKDGFEYTCECPIPPKHILPLNENGTPIS